jgi:hypothetical protein
MHLRTFCSLAILGSAAMALAAPASAQDSTFTRHKYEACVEAPSPEPGVIEVRRCAGKAGIAVRWMSEPDSSSVSFGDKPLDEDMGLGAAFEVGSTIEWRSARRSRTPIAAIVRYKTGAGVGSLNKSVLVVYRLEPSGTSCLMGVVGEPNAGAKARRLVDQSAGTFVCGKSARISER